MENLSSYNLGISFCNLLADKIIKIFDDFDENQSEITVTDHGNFIILNGKTSITSDFNMIESLNEFTNHLNLKRTLNFIDLIEYGSEDFKIESFEKIYSYKYSSKINEIVEKVNDFDHNFSIDFDNNLIFNMCSFPDSFVLKNYKVIESTVTYPIVSDRFYGLSSNSIEKLFDFYVKYICHNIFEKQLCKDLTLHLVIPDIKDISYETIELNIKSERRMTSLPWMKSMILDLFKLSPDHIIEKFDFKNMDFSDTIKNPTSNGWALRDMTKEMILF